MERILQLIKKSTKILAYTTVSVMLCLVLRACGPHIHVPSLVGNTNIYGEINSTTSSDFIKDMEYKVKLNKLFKKSYIIINIDSNGGSVIAGHNMITAIKLAKLQGNSVYCIVNKALSMAFTILQYCDVRIVNSESLLMQHQIHNGNGRENMTFDTNEEKVQIDFLDRLHGADEAKRMDIDHIEYEYRYRYGKWYKGIEVCLDKAADIVIDLNTGKYISCNLYNLPRMLLKKRLHDKASNAKIGR